MKIKIMKIKKNENENKLNNLILNTFKKKKNLILNNN